MHDIHTIPIVTVDWQSAYRLVSSRYPPTGLWDRIADPADFDALAEIEGITNPRLRVELGKLHCIPENRRIAGPGTSPIMAAFTHFDGIGSRFSDGQFGVFYAANSIQTAIAETRYHRAQFLSYTQEPPMEITMRCYICSIHSDLHDIRQHFDHYYQANNYIASQQLAKQLRAQNSNGLTYCSIRHEQGECVAIFWPDQVGVCRQTQHFSYYWNGKEITHICEKKTLTNTNRD